MQSVGPVRRPRLQPCGAHPSTHVAGAVDADVAALHERGVVLVGKPPAHLLGQPRGHGDGDGPTRPEHPGQLVERGLVVLDVLQHLGGDDPVEGVVGERQQGAVALHRAGERRRADLAGVGHRPEGVADLLELGLRVVEGHDLGAAAGGLVGVTAEAAAEVQQHVARLQAEALVAHGEHQGRPA